jgi:hypothetical protein
MKIKIVKIQSNNQFNEGISFTLFVNKTIHKHHCANDKEGFCFLLTKFKKPHKMLAFKKNI